MNKAGTVNSPLTRAPNELRNIAATIQLKTQEHDMAITLLDYADRLEKIIEKKELE